MFSSIDTATPEIHTLSLHDALPISTGVALAILRLAESEKNTAQEITRVLQSDPAVCGRLLKITDRKSTRLNSSHEWISYAVFCLKKKRAAVVRRLPPANGLHRRALR